MFNILCERVPLGIFNNHFFIFINVLIINIYININIFIVCFGHIDMFPKMK